MATGTGLVVPVNLVAYCVGREDAHDQTGDFAGATTSYMNMLSERLPASLGINVTRDFDQPPQWPLEEGIHLHWAAPDGLTHATQTSHDADLDFPALPNRWLVTRLLVQNGAVTARHWLVESDTLSSEPPQGKLTPTLPVQDDAQSYRHLGAWELFDGSWTEPNAAGTSPIRSLFKQDLHAVATGDIAFAALYPNARNVLGFWDDGSGLPNGGAPFDLSYVVTGWFSDSSIDPLSSQPALVDLQKSHRWTYGDSTDVPSYSLYNGSVHGVKWSPDTRYLGDSRPPVKVSVAMGNNPAEAMSAYFRGLNHPDLPLFEQLLSAFSMGLLSNFAQPVPGQLAALHESMHEKGFLSADSGSISTIVTAASLTAKSPPGDDDMAPNLPLPLADALNLLNQYQQQYDLAQKEQTQYRWNLFADWYRIFQVAPDSQDDAIATFARRFDLWPSIQRNSATAKQQLDAQSGIVNPMLGTDWVLKAVPAPRFWQPNEPVVLMAGDEIAAARRHGGDGRFDIDGYLVCRHTTNLTASATVGAGTPITISASEFASALPPSPNHLPYAVDVANLVAEACVLDASIAASRIAGDENALAAALADWLRGINKTGNPYQSFRGTLPSPVAVEWWAGENPWFPLLMLWEIDFHPLLATTTPSGLASYSPSFFTGNFALDPDGVGRIGYAPSGPGSIAIDPATIDFTDVSTVQEYSGAAVLTATSSDNFETFLDSYLKANPDDALQKILGELKDTNILMQALTGFNDALLMRSQSLQLRIGVPASAPMRIRLRTQQATEVIPDMTLIPAVAPLVSGAFNPIRAGFAKLKLRIVDTFGEKRPVEIDNLYLADSFTTTYRQTPEPGIVYFQPRLAQGARLLFRWLSADTSEFDEMNVHPATSPICGWLLTNHLQKGFFLYDQQGRPLGSLTLKGDESGVAWQSAPGDDGTIDQSVADALQHANPHLRDLATKLVTLPVAFFKAFYQAVDTAATSVIPSPSSGGGMAALIGRPVALAQASLRLELQGIAAHDLSLATRVPGDSFHDTDDGLGQVQFPAILGDIDRVTDGLVGYFTQDGTGAYDLGTFYSEAAPIDGGPSVVAPAVDTILLTPASTPEGQLPSVTDGERKVLVLLDPRAAVHVTSGILPTQTLSIPASQYADALVGLEMAFLATPLLTPAAGLAMPLPREAGYNWSWVEEERSGGSATWSVTPGIAAPTANAVWQYTPQTVTEGWMRLNPEVLRFTLANRAGAPVVVSGATTDLVLTVANERLADIAFQPGTIASEGTPATGSVFYIHFGSLVDQSNVSAIEPSAAGWSFQSLRDPRYGAYWGATPVAGSTVTLEPDGTPLSITLGNVQVAATTDTQVQVYFDYYQVTGVADGVDAAVVAVQSGS